jgi:hypothetical protein
MHSIRSFLMLTTAVATLAADAASAGGQTDSAGRRDSSASPFEFRNPNATRLLFAPTGRMLRKGEGYFSDFWVFFPGVNVGLTDRVSVGAMMSVFPGVSLTQQLYFVTPKVGVIQRPNLNVAAGAMLIGWGGVNNDADDGVTAGILYGVATRGGENGSITGGFGFGFVDRDFGSSPFVMLGGERRLSNRVAFVTENWLLPGGEHGLLSGGVRFLGSGMAVDFGVGTPIGSGAEGTLFPILGFVFKW